MDSRHYRVLPAVSRSYPRPEGRCLRVTIPFATDRRSKLPFTVRLACLIHAANVHSEPGSNPSIKIFGWKEFLLSYYNHVDPALPISSVTYWSLQVIELFKLTTCSQRKKQETISYSSFKVQCLFRQIVKGHLLVDDFCRTNNAPNIPDFPLTSIGGREKFWEIFKIFQFKR